MKLALLAVSIAPSVTALMLDPSPLSESAKRSDAVDECFSMSDGSARHRAAMDIVEDTINFRPDILPGWDSCGNIRMNYRCEGVAYDEYINSNREQLVGIENHIQRRPLAKRVLIIGNSHMREVGETLACICRSDIKQLQFRRRNIGLEEQDISFKCDGTRGNGCDWNELRARMHSGGHLYMIVNSEFMLSERGLREGARYLDFEWTSLDVVVVGHQNGCNFFQKEFLHFLHHMGFKGKAIVGGNFGSRVPPLSEGQALGFALRNLSSLETTQMCSTPKCTSERGGHQCLPGPPHFVGKEVWDHISSP